MDDADGDGVPVWVLERASANVGGGISAELLKLVISSGVVPVDNNGSECECTVVGVSVGVDDGKFRKVFERGAVAVGWTVDVCDLGCVWVRALVRVAQIDGVVRTRVSVIIGVHVVPSADIVEVCVANGVGVRLPVGVDKIDGVVRTRVSVITGVHVVPSADIVGVPVDVIIEVVVAEFVEVTDGLRVSDSVKAAILADQVGVDDAI